MNGDFKMDKNATIYHTPWLFKIENENGTEFKIGKGVKLRGKIMQNIETFIIRFYQNPSISEVKYNINELCFDPRC